MSSVRAKIDPSKLKELLFEVYQDVMKEDASSFVIRCPWHKPDNNPSCVIFFKTAIFYCPVCHGDKQKGKRGVSPYQGFRALGMPEAKAKKLFLDRDSDALAERNLDTTRLPSLDDPVDETILPPKRVLEEKVVSRSAWPEYWGFRDIEYETMIAPWFLERFDPTKVTLKRERLPRLALAVGGAKQFKPKNKVRHEVYLRLSSAVKPKAANSVGLSLDPDLKNSATLFGLVNNRLSKDCRGIFLVEGPYDAIHLLQHIHNPEVGGGFEVVALLGTPQWGNCLKHLQILLMGRTDIPIILAFDNDAAGFKLTHTAINDLRSVCYMSTSRLKTLGYPLSVKDPGDLTFDVFLFCLRRLGLV